MAGRRARLSVLLADKSALEWARRDKRARAAFLSLRTAHVIAACHMAALEICYSARNQADLEALLAAHSGNGHRRPIPDLIIAATAELHGAEVLHVDSDYDIIARVTDQPMRRLFDPGPT